MALPKLNETNWYEVEVPSTKQLVKYRPFLVKEQKQLLIAAETEDQRVIVNSILDTINVCIQEDFEVRTLTSFDTDYLFSRIRGKSVGETSEIIIKCESCEHSNEVKVNIMDSTIKGEMKEGTIQLTPEISVEMVYPSYMDLFKRDLFDEEGNPRGAHAVDMIASCIKAVITEEERIDLKNESKEEIDGFIDSLNSEQFERISGFIQNMPKLVYDAEFVCENCEKENKLTLEGIGNFF